MAVRPASEPPHTQADADGDQITAFVASQQEKLDDCALHSDRDEVIGDMEVSFTLTEDGKVSDASVLSSTIDDAKVERCVLATVRDWVLPLHRATAVQFPIKFQPFDSTPPLPRAAIVAVAHTISAHSADVDRCVALGAPDFEGDLTLDLDIDAAGGVTSAEARPDDVRQADSLAPAAQRCLSTAARSWKFSPLPSAARLSYSFSIDGMESSPRLRWSETNAIGHAIARHDEVAVCGHENKAKGEIVVRFTIGLAGIVTRAVVQSNTVPAPQLAACVLRAVKSWRFVRRGAPVTLSYSFTF